MKCVSPDCDFDATARCTDGKTFCDAHKAGDCCKPILQPTPATEKLREDIKKMFDGLAFSPRRNEDEEGDEVTYREERNGNDDERREQYESLVKACSTEPGIKVYAVVDWSNQDFYVYDDVRRMFDDNDEGESRTFYEILMKADGTTTKRYLGAWSEGSFEAGRPYKPPCPQCSDRNCDCANGRRDDCTANGLCHNCDSGCKCSEKIANLCQDCHSDCECANCTGNGECSACLEVCGCGPGEKEA